MANLKLYIAIWVCDIGYTEKRIGVPPVPAHPERYMNEEQFLTYDALAEWGWHIDFIRRPLFQRPLIVISQDNKEQAVLEDDGKLYRPPYLPLRH